MERLRIRIDAQQRRRKKRAFTDPVALSGRAGHAILGLTCEIRPRVNAAPESGRWDPGLTRGADVIDQVAVWPDFGFYDAVRSVNAYHKSGMHRPADGRFVRTFSNAGKTLLGRYLVPH